MYTKITFETAMEFFEACRHGTVDVPDTIYVVFGRNKEIYFSGEGAERFALEDNITQTDMIKAAFHYAYSKAHIT